MDLNAFFTDNGMTLELIIWSMFAGICLAAFIIMYNKNVLGPFVRALLKNGANSPQSAKSLAELGFTNKTLVKLSLKKRGSFRKIVQATAVPVSAISLTAPPVPDKTEEAAGAPDTGQAAENGNGKRKRKRPNLAELRFFIPESMTERADSIYLNGGASIFIVLLTIASFLIVALLLFKAIPAIVQMIENLVEYITLSSD